MNQNYIDTVRLLLAIAPAVFASGRFAMKGGTALNLFVQEMPRLSVDIDLVFVDHRPDRQAALQAIAEELAIVQAALARQGYLFPGIRKVVQVAGRVIRTPSDQGSVHLIDDRFARPEVLRLLPDWWRIDANATPGRQII
jgi:hypothetical protein